MPPTSPRSAQVKAALAAQLASIVEGVTNANGYTYWYTPSRVIRVKGVAADCVDESLDSIYCMSPDTTSQARNSTWGTHDAELNIDLDLFRKYRPEAGTENPFEIQGELREDLEDRMAADVEARLMEDPTYAAYAGLEVWDIQVVSKDQTPEATSIEGWARVILRVVVRYRYRAPSP